MVTGKGIVFPLPFLKIKKGFEGYNKGFVFSSLFLKTNNGVKSGLIGFTGGRVADAIRVGRAVMRIETEKRLAPR